MEQEHRQECSREPVMELGREQERRLEVVVVMERALAPARRTVDRPGPRWEREQEREQVGRPVQVEELRPDTVADRDDPRRQEQAPVVEQRAVVLRELIRLVVVQRCNSQEHNQPILDFHTREPCQTNMESYCNHFRTLPGEA